MYRELALLASYTLEASFAGASIGTSLPQHWRSGSPVEAEPAEGGALSEDGGGGGSGGSERTGGGSSERDDSGGEGDGESRGENSRIGNGHAQGAPWTPEDGDGRGGCSGEGSVRLSSAQLPPSLQGSSRCPPTRCLPHRTWFGGTKVWSGNGSQLF